MSAVVVHVVVVDVVVVVVVGGGEGGEGGGNFSSLNSNVRCTIYLFYQLIRLICAASNNNATSANVIFNFVCMFDLEMPCIYGIIEGLMEE